MAGGIPNQAIGASVGVLIYSAVCFTLCVLVFCLLLSYGERGSYISLLAFFAALSTLGSIIEQIHYATSWEKIIQAEFDRAVEIEDTPSLGVGRAAERTDVVLARLQYYCYNAMSLNVFFWAIALFCGIWGFRGQWLGRFRDKVFLVSKIIIFTVPGLIIGLQSVKGVIKNRGLFFFITYTTMCVSMTFGSVLLCLTLFKYVRSRQLTMGGGRRGGWWASSGSKKSDSQTTGSGGHPRGRLGSNSTASRSVYDRALIIRFTIGFVIMVLFQAAIIIFSVFQKRDKKDILRDGKPDRSARAAISHVVFFIPGVTVSLVVYLVFGTSKSWRQYRDLVFGICGLKRTLQRRWKPKKDEENSAVYEFERLPSMSNKSGEMSIKGREIETRVRMFSPTPPMPTMTRNSAGTFDSFTPDERPISPRYTQYHRPVPEMEKGIHIQRSISIHRSDVRGEGLNIEGVDDPIIQYSGNPSSHLELDGGSSDEEVMKTTVIVSGRPVREESLSPKVPVSKFSK